MRGVAIVIGGLLLIGGAAVVVLADQQRAAEVAALRAQIERVDERLDSSAEENLRLAKSLTALRATIAEQDAALGDTTGFLP